MRFNANYTTPKAACPADCPGRRSPWQAANSDDFPCPLGVAFCGCWDAQEVFFKSEREDAPLVQEAGAADEDAA